ncbi:hypothetical protein [Bacillus phage vB_BanS-Thrax1]|nr:hypothetical protein [Bacillus phage vB_BanS-Thrax1]
MFGRNKKQCSCGDTNIVWTEVVPYIGYNMELHYCQKCVDKKAQELMEQHEERERLRKEAEAEKAKNDYYLWLKREVEIKELEEKARKFGIDIEGGT